MCWARLLKKTAASSVSLMACGVNLETLSKELEEFVDSTKPANVLRNDMTLQQVKPFWLSCSLKSQRAWGALALLLLAYQRLNSEKPHVESTRVGIGNRRMGWGRALPWCARVVMSRCRACVHHVLRNKAVLYYQHNSYQSSTYCNGSLKVHISTGALKVLTIEAALVFSIRANNKCSTGHEFMALCRAPLLKAVIQWSFWVFFIWHCLPLTLNQSTPL